MISEPTDFNHGFELLFINSLTATLITYWDVITGGLQFILVLSAIAYNLIRIYSWFQNEYRPRRRHSRESKNQKDK